jgi:exo-beta-1,3-glucanase (GH17 family)
MRLPLSEHRYAIAVVLIALAGFVGALVIATVGRDSIPRRCIAFSPYVGNLDQDFGPHPGPALIDELLDVVIKQTGFTCILTYGVLNGLDYIFESAAKRGVKVIAIIWLDKDPTVNQASIKAGIEAAKEYADTIIRISCGSEFRTRNGTALDSILRDCITQVRGAGVTQPLTTIETWWEWCNRSWPCGRWDLADDVDWIGINVFPWWENRFSGMFKCTRAADAAEFHVARLLDVKARYSAMDVVITEFGWPAGPDGLSQRNDFTGETCQAAEASEVNQRRVVLETLAKLDTMGLRGVLFEAFREGSWKIRKEGAVGPFWGVCHGVSTFDCNSLMSSVDTVSAPPVLSMQSAR